VARVFDVLPLRDGVPTIRARLTAWYAAALGGTMLLFASILWVSRSSAGDRELQRYVGDEAQVAVRLLEQVGARRLDGSVPSLTTIRDTLVGPELVPQARALLDALPNVVIITDSAGRAVYRSLDARLLAVGEVDAVIRAATALTPTLAAKRVVVRDTMPGPVGDYVRGRRLPAAEEILIVRAAVSGQLTPLRTVIVGTPSSVSRRAEDELLAAMVAVAPVLLLVSLGTAWWLAGRAVRPLDRMIDEVEAITDGRSLHRRIAVEEGGDELARLGVTLNAMIGRLETSFAALRRFTADASHELKTPLTVLRANVERTITTPPDAPEHYVALEEALQEITRMSSLVDSLLTLARFDEGRFDLHREPVRLEPLVRDVHETATILGEAQGLEIRLAACEPALVLGDPTRLRQLFLNLVINAIKYTPRGGLVELALRRADETVAFSVRDSGIGIAAADLPYIFDRFWRADRARSRRVAPATADAATWERSGFGLGLAISQWIAQAHGGTISVISRLTRGTTFTVTVPLPTSADLAAAGAAEPERLAERREREERGDRPAAEPGEVPAAPAGASAGASAGAPAAEPAGSAGD
jgi:signal transduction histidine kinase